jgi:CubicO group peptidase (beta-lactamase class C family)/AcrR family transcriptional regulator
MENSLRLSKTDWLKAARLALLHNGHDGVRVEPLARDLGVTKGSFYWHFKDRNDLLEALLKEWEEETDILLENLGELDPHRAFEKILEEVKRRTFASEKGEWPSDVAIFTWAQFDPEVAKRVNKGEEVRMGLLRNFAERTEMADFFYYAYQGLLFRRRRVPQAVKDFDMLAEIALELMPPKKKVSKAKKLSGVAKRTATALLLVAATTMQGCSLYRTVRWQDPHPHVQDRIFPHRFVRHADTPFHFARGTPRHDLDTVSVRDTDARLKPFARYLVDRKIHAFVVIRNDTIVYERYRNYNPTQRWSSFSVAKSVASAVLGKALERGIISSLDDPVIKYLPELAKEPQFQGLTLRHLMNMQSGFAYERTTGNLWHDLRSDDAKFYYTTNMKKSLMDMRRVQAPPAPWAYKDSDVELLGWAMNRAAGKSVAKQLEDEIWRKIGTEHDATFSMDRDHGLDKVSAAFQATALDFARFARLYLNGGNWNGEQILPAEWVQASTTIDRERTEPEVTTWYRMQHNHLWWLPMHNWDKERDFFADGSRGQRVYVHPPTKTIIIQLADDSEQDFPFRKVAHYLAGQTYRYPRGILGLTIQAMQAGGIDSAKAVFRKTTAEEKQYPERYFLSRDVLLAVAAQRRTERKPAEADALYELARERYGEYCAARPERCQ